MSENKQVKKEDKIKVTDIDIIFDGKLNCEDKGLCPTYSIKYKKVGNNDYNVGYSSFDLEQVIHWKKEFFELVSEKEQNGLKHKVTNEELLEHLKHMMTAQFCVVNALNTLFSICYENRKNMYISSDCMEMILAGQEAMLLCCDGLAESSGLNKI